MAGLPGASSKPNWHLFGLDTIKSLKYRLNNYLSAVWQSPPWKKFSPDQPIRYTFLDQEFATMYDDVQRTGTIFTIFAG